MTKTPDNLDSMREAIVTAAEEIASLEAQRKTINDNISAKVEALEAQGLNRHALRIARKYLAMDENQRKNFDFAHNLIREALGAPVQADMFEDPADAKAKDDGDKK